jgi:MscS family membrane protein
MTVFKTLIRFRNISVILCFLQTFGLVGQEYPLDQKSPQSAVFKHFYYLQDDHFQPAKAAEVFGNSSKQNQQLAIQLKQIFDSRGYKPNFAKMPSNPEYIDTLGQKQEFIPQRGYSDIYLIRKNGKWQYSVHTILEIPKIHHEIFPLGTEALMNMIPGMSEKSFLGLKAWQYLGVLILIILGFILHKIFIVLIERIVRRLIQKTKVSPEFREAIHSMAIPLSYWVLVQIIHRLFPNLLFPSSYTYYIVFAFRIVLPIFLTIALYRLVNVFTLILKRRAEITETTLNDQLVPLFQKSAKVVVVIFGIVAVLNNLDFNLTALIAGVSIGGLAFALAAQDTIKNMFGSLMIFVDKPFQIGDLVSAEGFNGTIEEVGFRSTRIRTGANSLISVPNGKLVDMVVDNLGMRQFRRYKTFINLAYNTPIDQIELYVEGLRKIVEMHPQTRNEENEIHVNELSTSSINILFNVFFSSTTWTEELKVRHEIILETIRLADVVGVRFAFPTQTLHIETFSEKQSVQLNQNQPDSKEERYASYMNMLEQRFKLQQDSMTNEHFE